MNHRVSKLWLLLMSLIFYACWSPVFLVVLLVSVASNYAISSRLGANSAGEHGRSVWLTVGVCWNILFLGYFKYGQSFLPIGISFYTFVQIAYLVDVSNDVVKPFAFLGLCGIGGLFPRSHRGPDH